MQFKLEICADSVESAVNAQQAGAHRIELCSSLPEGGTTPSYGKILSARYNLDIDLNVIIRPRGADFLYSDLEYDEMTKEIEFCGEAGADGVVTGILLENGNIDVERMGRLVELADPMKVTFHRAFDLCADPFRGIEDIIATGAHRILTSGQKNSAADGSILIGSLVRQAGERIIIMPGGGININNIGEVAKLTGASEFHLTGRKMKESEMEFRRAGIMMGGSAELSEYSWKVADVGTIAKICEILKMI